MADKTWPTTVTKGFAPEAHEEGVKHDVEITTARNGRVTTRSLPGARWSATLKFPTLTMAHLQERRALEAFLTSLRGGADRLNLWNLLTPQPLGAFWGSPVLAVDAAAGARSVQISGALPRPNLMRYGGFDIEPGSGVATGWAPYAVGSSGVVSHDTDVNAGGRFQRVFTTALGASSADRAGVTYNNFIPVVAGQQYTFSADLFSDYGDHTVVLYVSWHDEAVLYVSEMSVSTVVTGPLGGVWFRRSVTGIVPIGATRAYFAVWTQEGGGNPRDLFIDNACFNMGAASTYPGPAKLLRGDRIAIGGRRVMVTADATANDAGALTVEFEGPLPAAVSAGAPVVFDRPTTKFILAAPLPDFPARADELPGFSIKLVEDPF